MALSYRVIEIYTSESARCAGRPVHEAVLDHVRDMKIPARCLVFKATEGCYENGEAASQGILELSYNMPLKIEIVTPEAEADILLTALEKIVCEGVVGVRPLMVQFHKTRKHLFPPRLRVRDVMTADPVTAGENTPVSRILELLLGGTFTGLPVVDGKKHPVGVVSQTDLIYRAKMPLRLALLANSAEKTRQIQQKLSHVRTDQIMSKPPVIIRDDELLLQAVEVMLEKGVKRLPAVNESGKLTGILSRFDIFNTIAGESSKWRHLQNAPLTVENIRYVSDIMERATRTVGPETSVEEVIAIIDKDRIQRVSVVDENGRFLGMISDRNLLCAFREEHPGIWDYLARIVPFAEKKSSDFPCGMNIRGKTAGQVMKTDIVTIGEDTLVEDAIALMVEKGFKHLPVVDGQNIHKGMISREALMKTAFAD